MKPLRLELEGLTSFRERTVVDFAPLQLFAITGPTGAGKSSLLDAILLALFGQVPRVQNKYKQLISDGRDQLAVQLDFAVAGAHYRVARRIKQKGQGLARLERVVGDAVEGLADRAGDVDAAIERILGVGYDAFVRSVVLPQGQFDQFLRGEPKERRAMLERLLGLSLYKRMAELAGETHRERQLRLQALDRLAQDLADATPQRFAELERERSAAEADTERLQRRIETLRALEQPAQVVRDARAALAQAEQETTALTRQVEAAEHAAVELERAGTTFVSDRHRLEAAIAENGVDPARLQQLATALQTLPALQRATAAATTLRHHAAQAAAALEAVERELQRAEAGLPQLESAVADHSQRREHAAAEVDRLQREHAAMHLRTALAAGRPCPVCEQPVTKVPAQGAVDFATAERRRDRAEADLRATERLRDEAERTVRERNRELPRLREAAAAAATTLAAAEQEVAALQATADESGIEEGLRQDPARTIPQLQQEQRRLQRAAEAAREATRRLDALLAAERERAERIAAARAQAGLLRNQLQQRRAALEAAKAAVEDSLRALATALQEAGEAPLAPVDRPPRGDAGDEWSVVRRRAEPLARELAAAQRRAGELSQQVAALEHSIERAGRLAAERDGVQAEVAVAKELAQLLQGNRFQDYVQEEVLRLLTDDGSARLLALSQGRYSLQHDGGDFLVVDHWNADRARSVRTLSGGETFQASLALSLALAERIAALAAGDRAATMLECLFIDEGFGALDPEALEAAVQALEALQGGERMVGVITHLPELAERLPARLVVHNDGGRATVAVR